MLIGASASISATAGEAETTLESLREADRARETAAAERAAWDEERTRLKLLTTSAEEQAEAIRDRARATRRRLAELRASAPPPPESVLADLESAAELVAARIDRGLARLRLDVLPGLVPPEEPGTGAPAEALDAALHRLERAERATRSVEVTVASGELDGELRSVELVRLGGVAAWWRGLDGRVGGEAAMEKGRLRLFVSEDPADLDAIARASAIAKGRAAPEVVLLPVAHARTSTEGGAR